MFTFTCHSADCLHLDTCSCLLSAAWDRLGRGIEAIGLKSMMAPLTPLAFLTSFDSWMDLGLQKCYRQSMIVKKSGRRVASFVSSNRRLSVSAGDLRQVMVQFLMEFVPWPWSASPVYQSSITLAEVLESPMNYRFCENRLVGGCGLSPH